MRTLVNSNELIQVENDRDQSKLEDLLHSLTEKMRSNVSCQFKQLNNNRFANRTDVVEIKDLYNDIRDSLGRILHRESIPMDRRVLIRFILEETSHDFFIKFIDVLKAIRSEINGILDQLIESDDSDYLFSYDFDQKNFSTDVYSVLKIFESMAPFLNEIKDTKQYTNIFNQLNGEDKQKRLEYANQGQKITEVVSRILVQDDGSLRFLDAIKDFKQVRFQYLISSNNPDLKQMHEQKKQHCIDTVNFLIINYLHILKSGISGQLTHEYLNHEHRLSIFQLKNIKGFLLSLNCMVLFLHSIERGLELEGVLKCAID